MKKRQAMILVAVLAMLMLIPAAQGLAMSNEFSFGIAGGSGDVSYTGGSGDVAVGGLHVGYRHFFTPLATTDAPLGAREFLQHPAFFGVSLESVGVVLKNNTGTQEIDSGTGVFSFGGMYYFKNANVTGIGATLISEKSNIDTKLFGITTDKDDITAGTLLLHVDQYIGKTIKLNATLGSVQHENKDDNGSIAKYSEGTLNLSAAALINNRIILEGGLGGGSRDYDGGGGSSDISGLWITGGYYLSQRVGVFLSIFGETVKGSGADDSTSSSALSGEFHFSERAALSAAITSVRQEDKASNITIEYSMLDLNLTILF